MKNIIFLLLAACFMIASKAQQTVRIIGSVKGDTKGFNKIYLYGEQVKSDSSEVKNGFFEFTVPFKDPIVIALYDEFSAKIKKGISPFVLVIDRAGTINIKDIDIEKGLYSGTLSGISSAKEYQEFTKSSDPAKTTYQRIENFITTHPDSYTAALVLNSHRGSLSVAEVEKLFSLLGKNARNSGPAKSILTHLQGIKVSGIGKTVENFTLFNPKGEPIEFSSLKGKYVIIDFWASWCGPCKQSFPHMREIYSRYKADGLDIYSISIDSDKSAWLKSSSQEDFPWPQTLDTVGISSAKFGVTAIPTTFLIGPDGKILLRETGFDPSGKSAIEQKITELFGKK